MAWPRKRPVLPARQWRGETRRGVLARVLRAWRPWLIAGLILLAASQWSRLFPRLFPPPPPAVVEQVDKTFVRCGQAHGDACVVEGDTFHIGARRIRVQGIDAPELHPPRCAEEARLGEAAAAALLAQLNARPSTMTSDSAHAFDEYGRELRRVTRTGPDGKPVSIGDALVAAGLAREFLHGQRGVWCG